MTNQKNSGNGYVPFTPQNQQAPAAPFLSAPQPLYAGAPLVNNQADADVAGEGAENQQTPLMPYNAKPVAPFQPAPQKPMMPQTPYAYAQNMANEADEEMKQMPNAPLYFGAPMIDKR